MFTGHESLRLFLWGFLTGRVYRTNPYAVQELQAEIEAVAEEMTGDMMRDRNFVIRLQRVDEGERSHIEDVFT
jgi:hypothetical protein